MKQLVLRYLGFIMQTATVGDTALTLSDWAQRRGSDGNVDDIVEVLSRTNEIIEDMLWVEGNAATSHTTTIRTGYPTGTWRMLNYGVGQEKSRTAQIADGMGMLETYSKVDKSLAELNGDTAAFRFSEDVAFIEGLNQTFASTLFYGAASEPEKFVGFAPRYNGTPQITDDLVNTFNIIDAGGTGTDNTSIWIVVWGANTCHGIFPKGGSAGLSSRDLGEDTLTDAAGGEYQGYRTHYKWDCGLTIRDWRYVSRIANIDVSALTKDASAGADLLDLLVQLVERPPSLGMGRPVIYCNRTIRSFLRRQILNKDNVYLNMEEVAGKQVLSFDSLPVRRTDAILNTEARVL